MANGEQFDVTIIGSGPGGYVAAIRAGQLGLRTAVVERDPAGCGGTCLHRGCIPTKALLHTADLYEDLQRGKEFGIRAENVSLDFAAVMSRKQRIVTRLSKGIESYLFRKNHVTLFKTQFSTSLHLKVGGPGVYQQAIEARFEIARQDLQRHPQAQIGKVLQSFFAGHDASTT